MAKTNEIIISEIKAFMAKWGGRYIDWYVGIVSDPRQRLFNDHGVNEKIDIRNLASANQQKLVF